GPKSSVKGSGSASYRAKTAYVRHDAAGKFFTTSPRPLRRRPIRGVEGADAFPQTRRGGGPKFQHQRKIVPFEGAGRFLDAISPLGGSLARGIPHARRLATLRRAKLRSNIHERQGGVAQRPIGIGPGRGFAIGGVPRGNVRALLGLERVVEGEPIVAGVHS